MLTASKVIARTDKQTHTHTHTHTHTQTVTQTDTQTYRHDENITSIAYAGGKNPRLTITIEDVRRN